MIGTNPRYEATMVNARIRKAFLNNDTKIISLNNIGDLTYPYESLDGNTQTLKDIFDNNNELSKKIINSKKPLIIIGESFLRIRSAEYLFNLLKDFLKKNEKISSEWNPLNVLSVDAGTVGNLDLDIIDRNNKLLDEVKENKFEIIYLVGQDNLEFK